MISDTSLLPPPLHEAGASLDELPSLLGYRNRNTTDRYVTVDRENTGKILRLMPNLRQEEPKRNTV